MQGRILALALPVVVSLLAVGVQARENPSESRSGSSESNCDVNLTRTGLTSDELMRQLTESKRTGKDQDRAIRILNESSELDHTILGPQGQEVLKRLNQLMVGHPEVKLALARAVQRGATGTKNPAKPVATFLLLGITGVGKTLTAEALTEALHDDPSLMVKISGGEVQKDHEISKVTGSPAGYAGHDSTPPLVTQEIIDRNTSERFKVNVVLVDELEKGAKSLEKLLLGVMDKGHMTTGTNEPVDLSNSILIITSNLGQTEMNQILNDTGPTLGFSAGKKTSVRDRPAERKERIEKAAQDAIKNTLSPEFRNRIDAIFVFDELSSDDSNKVLNVNLATIQRRSFFSNPETRVLFSVTPEAREFILTHGYVPAFGGRSIQRTIEHTVVEPLTNLIASNQVKAGDLVEVGLGSAGLTFKKIAESLSPAQQQSFYSKIYGDDVPALNLKKISSYDEEKYNSRTYPEFLGRLDVIKDPHVKLDMIEDFLAKSPQFNDQEFLDLFERLPDDMNWGRKDSTITTAAMKKAGFGNWKNMPFEPSRLNFIWQGMKRIKTLSPARRNKMNAIIGPIEESVSLWMAEQHLADGFQSDLKKFLIQVHANVMELPAPEEKKGGSSWPWPF